MIVFLRDFLARGVVPEAPFGCDRQHLESAFGPPEATGGTSRKYRQPIIWKYGDIEFSFSRETGGMDLIHIDGFSNADCSPQGWGGLTVDPWIVRQGLSRRAFCHALDHAGLSYSVRSEPGLRQEIVDLGSQAKVHFLTESEQGDPPIGLIALSKWG